ncbi:hypothetical protein Y1Q_0013891 [Alligator mississippiensis]|uniref:Uncharacterized protein n=1 Tax=Alligator mississippiensis TaxID=8496 RepID=A0A151MP63_ALLMI|nr:hypothetical protein Y1Q_0013891 [Alligator mississippiensis]
MAETGLRAGNPEPCLEGQGEGEGQDLRLSVSRGSRLISALLFAPEACELAPLLPWLLHESVSCSQLFLESPVPGTSAQPVDRDRPS